MSVLVWQRRWKNKSEKRRRVWRASTEKSKARNEKAKDLAKPNLSSQVATFNMEAVCSCHAHLSASATTKEDLPSITCPHFLWQTNNHLVTCGWIGSQESLWDQTCLFLHLKSVLLTVSCVIFHCDSYSGQNRNQFVAAALQQAAQTMPSVQTTDHRVLESGHSQMKWLNHQYTQPVKGQNKSQQSRCLLDVETFEREELR